MTSKDRCAANKKPVTRAYGPAERSIPLGARANLQGTILANGLLWVLSSIDFVECICRTAQRL